MRIVWTVYFYQQSYSTRFIISLGHHETSSHLVVSAGTGNTGTPSPVAIRTHEQSDSITTPIKKTTPNLSDKEQVQIIIQTTNC